jgi:dTDP-glucose pyrophosphorylase
MKNIEQIKILATSTIEKALRVIDSGAVKIALVVDSDKKLLGTLNDGDIRRGLLKRKAINETIEDIYSKDPITANNSKSKEELLRLCLINGIAQIPIIDESRKVIDLYIMDDGLSNKQYKNHVVLMVGGLGSRMRPLTENTPKPMLEIGGKPILERIVKQFVDSGFFNITMCLGYKSKVIRDYFKDGVDFGANIEYVIEDKRMGTAGALTLIKNKFNEPFFVMNGDLLTNVDFEEMLNFHESNNSKATMCIREYDMKVPYGVVSVSNNNITSIDEKPIHSFFVNAGLYLLDSECINLIPSNEFYDMPSLFEELIAAKEKIVSFPLKEYWLDIGRISDYERAVADHHNGF